MSSLHDSNDSSLNHFNNNRQSNHTNGQIPQNMSGLDLQEATSYTSSDPNKAVLLRLDVRGNTTENLIPITIPARFIQVVNEHPNAIALKYQLYEDSEQQLNNGARQEQQQNKSLQPIDQPWHSVTYLEFLEHVRNTAKAFIAVGLEPRHSVGILGFNSPEWFYSNYGAIFAGGISTGIYATNSNETCLYVLNDSQANVVVVEDAKQMAKILKIRNRLPHLKAIVQYKGDIKNATRASVPVDLPDPGNEHFTKRAEDNCKIYTWNEFIKFSDKVSDSTLDQIISSLKANMCCTLIYTSGTTGNPKGVMLSHDNITWTARQTAKMIGVRMRKECILSYLPLSHIAAQVVDIYVVLETANTVYFAHPDALKGTLVQYLKFVRPTIFIGVPRVWEKISEKMQDLGKTTTGIKKKISTWAKGVGLEGSNALMRGDPTPWSWGIANMLVYKKVRKALGLNRCHYLISAGAPLSKDTRLYLSSLNLQVMEVFGMSECTGPTTVNYNGVGNYWGGSVGLPLFGTQIRISGEDYEESTGEICIRGRHVFMGYIHREAETQDTIDKNGWLKSGDLGKIESTETASNFIYITGRIKELIITAGGENVAPVPIEDAIKEELKILISNAMVIGDFKKYLSVLLTIRTETDSSGTPTDTLTPGVQDWLSTVLGSGAHKEFTTLTQLVANVPSPIVKIIDAAIKRVNDKGISRAASVKKWRIVPKDFSVVGGELGPTMKLRRPIVVKMYSDLIDFLYKDDEPEDGIRTTGKETDNSTTNAALPFPPKETGMSNLKPQQYYPGNAIADSTTSLKHSESYITHI